MSKDSQLVTCHDCNVLEGEIHDYGYDVEECPFCGRRLMECDCIYDKLHLDRSFCTKLYEESPTLKREKKWLKILEKKGRIPFIKIPNLCALCGENWPAMFILPDSEWEKYVIPPLQEEMLCPNCYDFLKKLWPDGWKSPVRRKEPE